MASAPTARAPMATAPALTAPMEDALVLVASVVEWVFIRGILGAGGLGRQWRGLRFGTSGSTVVRIGAYSVALRYTMIA